MSDLCILLVFGIVLVFSGHKNLLVVSLVIVHLLN